MFGKPCQQGGAKIHYYPHLKEVVSLVTFILFKRKIRKHKCVSDLHPYKKIKQNTMKKISRYISRVLE